MHNIYCSAGSLSPFRFGSSAENAVDKGAESLASESLMRQSSGSQTGSRWQWQLPFWAAGSFQRLLRERPDFIDQMDTKTLIH